MYNFSEKIQSAFNATDFEKFQAAYLLASENTRDEFCQPGDEIFIDETGVKINDEYSDEAEQYFVNDLEEILSNN
jgi:hypothetical protein